MAMQFSVENTMSLNNSSPTVQNFLLGHVMTLASEKQTCDKNLDKILDPADGSGAIAIIGPIQDFDWNHVAKDPITLSGLTDQTNNGKLLRCIGMTNSSLHFKIQFTVYRYDLKAKKWIKFYDVESPLEATLTPSGTRYVSPNPVQGFENPKLFPYTLTFSPDKVGEIVYAPLDGDKEILKWGTNG
ncbi:MAG: hypothetical protein LLG04_11885 [Parachlamydia sp.]|nr:hypothetical protein [Parachlamydia sp.]